MKSLLETDLLAELIRQKHDVLVQLHGLARRQLAIIDQRDMSQLLVLLSGKQTLLGELQKVERQLTPFRHEDPETRRWRSAADRRRCAEVAERCQSLLGEIMQAEKQSETDLVRRRDEAAVRLQGAHTAAEARSAYTQSTGGQTGCIDLTSET